MEAIHVALDLPVVIHTEARYVATAKAALLMTLARLGTPGPYLCLVPYINRLEGWMSQVYNTTCAMSHKLVERKVKEFQLGDFVANPLMYDIGAVRRSNFLHYDVLEEREGDKDKRGNVCENMLKSYDQSLPPRHRPHEQSTHRCFSPEHATAVDILCKAGSRVEQNVQVIIFAALKSSASNHCFNDLFFIFEYKTIVC